MILSLFLVIYSKHIVLLSFERKITEVFIKNVFLWTNGRGAKNLKHWLAMHYNLIYLFVLYFTGSFTTAVVHQILMSQKWYTQEAFLVHLNTFTSSETMTTGISSNVLFRLRLYDLWHTIENIFFYYKIFLPLQNCNCHTWFSLPSYFYHLDISSSIHNNFSVHYSKCFVWNFLIEIICKTYI